MPTELHSFLEALSSCLFQLLEAVPLKVISAHGPPPSSKPVMLPPLTILSQSRLPLTKAGETSKDSCDQIEPTQIIQANLLISRSLTLIRYAKSLLPGKVTYLQVQGNRMGTSLEGHYCLSQIGIIITILISACYVLIVMLITWHASSHLILETIYKVGTIVPF